MKIWPRGLHHRLHQRVLVNKHKHRSTELNFSVQLFGAWKLVLQHLNNFNFLFELNISLKFIENKLLRACRISFFLFVDTCHQCKSVWETIRKPPLLKAQTALNKQNETKYGEKRFSIWRMELLHPAMWHVALGWRAKKFAQTFAILEFYIWSRFWPYHRSRRVILHQSWEILSKSDHPQQTKWRHVDFQDGGSQPSWISGVQ